MKILHGTWIPADSDVFTQSGAFYLWVETSDRRKFPQTSQQHPRQLMRPELAKTLTEELGIQPPPYRKLEDFISPQYFLLPSVDKQPLPSLELSRYLEEELPETFEWRYWQVDCYKTMTLVKTGNGSSVLVNNVIHLLNELHFIAMHNLAEVQLGSDLLFWFHFTQALKRLLFKDQYIPSLRYRELAAETKPPKTRSQPVAELLPEPAPKTRRKSAKTEPATEPAKTRRRSAKAEPPPEPAPKSRRKSAQPEPLPEPEPSPKRLKRSTKTQTESVPDTPRKAVRSRRKSTPAEPSPEVEPRSQRQPAPEPSPETAPGPRVTRKIATTTRRSRRKPGTIGMARATKAASTTIKTTAVSQPVAFEVYPGWEWIGDEYENTLREYVEYMPLACAAGFAAPLDSPEFYDRHTLLRHFSECILTEIVTHTHFTQAFEKTIADSLVQECLGPNLRGVPWRDGRKLEQYQQWQGWRDRIVQTQTDLPFHLCFQLQDPAKPEDPWLLQFQVAPRNDPSARVALEDFWRMRPKQQEQVRKWLGAEFEQNLLMNLGYAARIYPDLWQGLETDQPVGIHLNLDAAFAFLKESAWVLENAGYKVIVPAWWTPQGRQRAKIRLRAKGKSLAGGEDKAKQYFSYDSLVQYQYELAIGGERISQQEWQQLVNAKTPLVKFRGQWMELDQDRMKQMLEFWQKQQQDNPELSLLDFIKLTAGKEDELEVEVDRQDSLAEMLNRLGDQSQMEPVENPRHLQGNLREYQKRGVSWLNYLEQLGINGCLADDMGLGKTVQVIARLLQEREQAEQSGIKKLPPTLLVAPTSVVGNWYHELHKFAPTLRAVVHHGGDRARDSQEFKRACRQNDVVITSFALARKDAKLFSEINWHRIVLDEAQNIKNPKAELTRAILKLPATHRLALTGTPVENRLLDLWSIFNFLNPGYLGNQTQFRKNFELPIQKSNDLRQSTTLKKLVEPFILRRVKTDPSIIKDLPDKIEQKLYCNLTKEQASLYEAVVKDVTEKMEGMEEGIQRKGLILATLTKLKQVCNHPMQFLQDGSEFTPERSHKLSRLSEMVEEAIAEGESILVFTQFTELGAALEKYLRHTCHYNTYYLHGGTSRKKREQMISEFQNPESEPSVFVLSLKAGGVGITLTRANHVFHFDRWWNPAVEDQATDRAFRIGQKKNVFVHKFIAMGTLEERIDEMIEDKKKLAGAIVGADESWLTELDNEAFRKLIVLNRSAILE